jgi:hypothetical protein
MHSCLAVEAAATAGEARSASRAIAGKADIVVIASSASGPSRMLLGVLMFPSADIRCEVAAWARLEHSAMHIRHLLYVREGVRRHVYFGRAPMTRSQHSRTEEPATARPEPGFTGT